MFPCLHVQPGKESICGCCWVVSVVSDSLQPYGLQPARFLCLWRFSRREYWNRLPSPPPEDLPDPGIKPGCALAGRFFTTGTTSVPLSQGKINSVFGLSLWLTPLISWYIRIQMTNMCKPNCYPCNSVPHPVRFKDLPALHSPQNPVCRVFSVPSPSK